MEAGDSTASFSELSAAEQVAVREAQKRKKLAKAQAKQAKQRARADATEQQPAAGPGSSAAATTAGPAGDLLAAVASYPTRISLDSYFGACPGGGFRDPGLPPTEQSLALLMRVLQAGDEQARSLNTCNYFQFSGSADAVWDPTFNARLAWEGFFTITTARRARGGARGDREPLPELQPFYGVLTWPNFYAAKNVQTHLGRMRRRLFADSVAGEGTESAVRTAPTRAQASSRRRLCLEDNADRRTCWQHLEDYHSSPARAEHGDNWLTERYFEMMVAASDDPSNSFRMHTILMVEEELEWPEDVGLDGADGKRTSGEAPAGGSVSTTSARVIRCDQSHAAATASR